MKRNESIDDLRHQMIPSLKGHLRAVQGQSVKAWTVQARKSLKLIHRPLFVKHHGIALQSMGSIENPGAATGRFLRGTGMGGRIRAEKKTGISTRRGATQGQAMSLPFSDWQAIKIASQAS